MTVKTDENLACVVLAAGRGKRLKSALPKALHDVAGRPLLHWVVDALENLGPSRVIVVAGAGMDDLREAVAPHATCIQDPPRGTGDAVRAALPSLAGFTGDVLIVLADMPFLSTATLEALRAARHAKPGTGLSVLAADLPDPAGFGRLVRNPDGTLARIVEDRDANAAEKAVTLCNMGAFCVDGARLAEWIGRIRSDNAQNEFYVTDLPAIAAADGCVTAVHIVGDAFEIQGANTRAELAALERAAQCRLRARAMENGATLIDPDSVFLSWDTRIGRDVVIEPNVFFGPGVTIGNYVIIRAFSHLEGATVESGASIGPFARLRPGARIGADCRVGNFVEIKNATLGEGAKASHLAYIGDAEIGARTNFSCGAITANYDGYKKSKTVIGSDAMIGSNVTLVAPLTVADGAYVGAGTTLTRDVPSDALAVAREKPVVVEGWAARRRMKAKAS